MRRVLSVICGLTLIAVCATDEDDNLIYRNLYGFKDNRISLREALQRLAVGAVKFLNEGSRLLANEVEDSTPGFNQEYDFIVVGAGSAGAVVASRLSEVKNVTVLLIEAGRSENLFMDVPIIVNYFQLSDELNWKYQTESSTRYCQGMVGKKCNWPRGKVMGGSSVLNYMIATRGNPLDYDGWAAMGNEGWSYKEVLRYFKKLEGMGIPELRDNEKMHSTKGPLHITYPPYHTPLARSFLEAGLEMGYTTTDYNAEQDVGFSYLQTTMKNGSRMSTNRAYLHPARRRKNLLVTKLSHVNRVLIDPDSKRAYGVEFTKSNANIQVRAKKEVILCGGTIGSAQILMLSGVGPSKHLNKMEIDVIQDAPVGENLMDHIAYGGLVFLVDQPVSITQRDLSNPMHSYISDYFMTRSGPLSVPGGCEALAFMDVDKPGQSDAYPNIELLFLGGSLISWDLHLTNLGFTKEHRAMFSNITGYHSWSILPMLMRPKSRGRILLRSADPKAKPRIFANYLDDADDVRVIIKGIRAAIQVSKTKAMRRFKSQLHDVPVVGCEDYDYDSDEYWECALRTFTLTIYHHSGTCKMAPEDDPTGVVNPRLQVRGIKGLRVADASIMPMINTGHTNIPVIMIGEKLADMVKEDWGYSTH